MFNVDPSLIVDCTTVGGCESVRAVVISLLLFLTLLTGFAYTTLLERRFIGWIQARVGPNRAGPGGLLFPIADAVKLFFKEDIVPSGSQKIVYWLAPAMKVIPIIMVAAVVPVGPPILVPWFDGLWYRVPLTLIDVNVGVLFMLAFLSLGTYGVVLAGWSSNNKYSMLGGLRATAQMVSYELSMGVTMTIPMLITGSMSLQTIVNAQNNPQVLGWFVFQNPLAAAILMISLIAEVNRAPFDLPEAEQELTAGYHTEYSGMKFALFFMAEYIGMIVVSMIVISLYFGGYHFFFVDQIPILGPLVFAGKVIVFLVGLIWVRATLPRIRYDRLMSLGWKVLFPLALVAAAWTAVSVVLADAFQSQAVYIAASIIFSVLALGFMLFALRGPSETERRGDVVVLERRTLGMTILGVVGVLLSIPFAIFGAIQRALRNFQAAGRDEQVKH